MTRAAQLGTAVVAGAVWLAAVVAGELSNFPTMTAVLVLWGRS